MWRYPLALLLASAVIAAAQPASPSPPAAEATAVAPAPARPRAVSNATADALKSALPKSAFVKPAEKKPEAEPAEARAPDKPQNEIIRLPKYLVRETKPRVLREEDTLAKETSARRLAQRYYSEGYLAFSRLVGFTPLKYFLPSAEASAMAQFADEERLRLKAEYADLTNMVMRSDPVAGAKVKNITTEMFMHKTDFGWQGGKPE